MNKQEILNRVITQSRATNHAHVLTGKVEIIRENNNLAWVVEKDGDCVAKQVLLSDWLNGEENAFPEKHKDIIFEAGDYKYQPQIEKNPFDNEIREIMD